MENDQKVENKVVKKQPPKGLKTDKNTIRMNKKKKQLL